MTLEFEKPPFLSSIGLNSSYNNETDFTAFDRLTSKVKKSSVISVTRKEKNQDSGEMSGRYSDDYDSYEDDFDSPSPTKETSRRYSRSSRHSRRSERDRSPSASPPKYRSRSKRASSRRDSFASYRSAYGTTRGPAKPRTKKSQSANSKVTTKTTGGESSMMRRVLSANKHKVSRLTNIMEELQQEVEELKTENRSLKRVSHRQEREIKKIDEEEAALPLLLQRHSAEMRTLKERLKKNQKVLYRKERESQDRDHEIQKLRDKVKSYHDLTQGKKLEERAVLAKKLENIENEMALKDKKIMDLEKAITLKDKARQREMKEQKDRYKHAKEELKRVQEDFRSLHERLQEKEKELDQKNIYHYHITKQKKKGATLPALPAGPQAPAIAAPVVHAEKAPDTQEKRANVFLTNAPSDTGSEFTDEVERSFKAEVRQDKPDVSKAAKTIVLEANKGDEDDENRLRRDSEERRKLEEEEQRRHSEEEERKRRDEEEKRKAEEERRRREEEDRLNKQRKEEEEDRKRFEEDAEVRRKKDLLLARIRAIDAGNDKADNSVTTVPSADDPPVESKAKKLPIFLQSDKPEPKKVNPAKSLASDDDILSDTSGDRKKHSSALSKRSSYSYEFKQTVENLHHGLPAHASLESVKDESAKVDAKDSLSDDLSFGSYKPTLGRRAAAKRDSRDKDELSFGGYNPSFGAKKDTPRKNSGLDFGAEKKAIPQKEQNGVIFGDYKPTLGGAPTKPASTQQNGDIFGEGNSSVRNRRPRGLAGKGASVFGDDLFENDNPKPTGEPLFGDKSLNKDKSSYPWENKVDVTRKNSEGDSLLPRRKQLQSFGKSTERNVRAVNNALDDIDDEIEEVIL